MLITNELLNLEKKLEKQNTNASISCSFPTCPSKFCTQSGMTRHFKRKHVATHKENVLYCNTCNRKFSKDKYLTRHIRTMHDRQDRFYCFHEKCKCNYSRKWRLAAHLKEVHNCVLKQM